MKTNRSKKSLTTDASLLKQINYARILGLLRCQPRLTRAEIARQLGLTRSTVTVITAELITEGLIREGKETTPGTEGGRPGVELELNPEGAFFIGVAIGVEDIRVVELDLSAQVVNRVQEPIRSERDPATLSQQLVRLIRQVQQASPERYARARGIGITVPGSLNREGCVLRAPLLYWHDVNLRTYLEPHIDLPLFIDNDANAAALAEVYLSSTTYSRSLLYILLDVGVGGGIVINNRLLRGADGTANEISEMMVDPQITRGSEEARPGTLGDLVSKTGLLKHYYQQSGEWVDLSEFLTRLAQSDAIAQTVVQAWAQFLGWSLIGLVNILNPERVVFGGQLIVLLPFVKDQLNQMLRNCVPRGDVYGFSNHADSRLEISRFGEDSAAIGGAVLGYQSLFQVPDLVLLQR